MNIKDKKNKIIELENELAKLRKEISEIKAPTLISADKRDFSRLEIMLNAYIKDLEDHNYVDEDFNHYVYEEVMKIFFGPNVFKWINSKL